jgi:hypothetical protein
MKSANFSVKTYKGVIMFCLNDIKRVKKTRPDLSDDQASEVLGFLNDVYYRKSYKIKDTDKLFKETAGHIYPLSISA